MNKVHIKNLNNYIRIDEKYSGGNIEILEKNDDLKTFSRKKGCGFFELNDCLIYELHKYKDRLGSYESLNLNLEEYSNILRNNINPGPYRSFGFISLESIKAYIERLFIKRRLETEVFILRDPVSINYMKDQIGKIIAQDHVLIMQSNSEYKYSLLLGIEGEEFIVSRNGNIIREKITSVYEYDDKYFGFLYLNFNV